MHSDSGASLPERIHSTFESIKHHIWLIVTVFAILFTASTVYIMQMPKVFRSRTQILVNPQRVSDKYVSSVVSMGASERLNTLSQQILSSSRLENILDEFNLFSNLRGRYSREELIEKMRKNIAIELKQSSDGLSSFTLSYTGDSAEEVAAVTNKLANSFITWNLHDREQEAQGTTAFLSSELATTKADLDHFEEQLRTYKMQHLGQLPDQMQANMQTLARLQVQLQANTEAQARLDHEALIAANTSVAGSNGSFVVTTSPRQQLVTERNTAQSELIELKKHYTETFPDVAKKRGDIRDLDEQIAALPAEDVAAAPVTRPNAHMQLISRDRIRLVNEQRSIQSTINQYQSRVDAEPVREQEISQILRDYDTAREHYRSLLEKTYSAKMAVQLEQQQQGGSFTMLDYARVPDAPIGPMRVPLLIGALFFSLAGGICAGLLSELLDSSVKSEAELRDCLPGIPLLGITPGLAANHGMRRTLTPTRQLLGGQ